MAAVLLAGALAGWAVNAHASAEASRGAALYLQLPGGQTSCVGCHGPDPAANRNNLLRAADQPAALQKALGTVSAMGFLRDALDDARIADLSPYLGRVLLIAGPDAPLAVWPRSVEFGTLGLGEVSAVHRVSIQNRRSTAVSLVAPQAIGIQVDLGHDCPASLLPGASCSIVLRASGARFGPEAGALQLASDAHSVPLLVPLSYAVIDAPAGRLSLSLSDSSSMPEIDFGSAPAPSVVVREFALRSHGGAPVTLGVSAITGPGAGGWVLGGDCVAERVLAPGTSCNARLTWAANAPGPTEAAVQWRSSGASPGTLKLTASVTATTVPSVPPPVAMLPTPGATTTPAQGSGGGAFSALFTALLAGAALGLVMGRSRKRHASVTQGL